MNYATTIPQNEMEINTQFAESASTGMGRWISGCLAGDIV